MSHQRYHVLFYSHEISGPDEKHITVSQQSLVTQTLMDYQSERARESESFPQELQKKSNACRVSHITVSPSIILFTYLPALCQNEVNSPHPKLRLCKNKTANRVAGWREVREQQEESEKVNVHAYMSTLILNTQ